MQWSHIFGLPIWDATHSFLTRQVGDLRRGYPRWSLSLSLSPLQVFAAAADHLAQFISSRSADGYLVTRVKQSSRVSRIEQLPRWRTDGRGWTWDGRNGDWKEGREGEMNWRWEESACAHAIVRCARGEQPSTAPGYQCFRAVTIPIFSELISEPAPQQAYALRTATVPVMRQGVELSLIQFCFGVWTSVIMNTQ